MKSHPIFRQVRDSWQRNPQEAENGTNQRSGHNHALAIIVLAVTAITTTIVAGYASSGVPATAAPPATIMNSAMTVSEDSDHYLVTLSTPANDSEKINVRMKGTKLQIASGHKANGPRFEQSLLLPQADPLQNPSMERSGDQLLITVPKATGTVQVPTAPSASRRTTSPSAVDPMDQDVMGQFARMQQQMDAMMKQAFQNFGPQGSSPGMVGGGFANAMQGGVAVNIENQPNAYVVHAQVPDKNMKNIRVSVDNDRVLNISAENSSSVGGGTASMSSQSSSSFSQMLTLPGPVQSKDMKIDHQDGELRITLPKA